MAILTAWALHKYAFPIVSIIVGLVVLAIIRVIALRQHIHSVQQSMPFIATTIREVLQAEGSNNKSSLQEQAQQSPGVVAWIVVACFWVVHMGLGLFIGQLVYLHKNCTNRFAAWYYTMLRVSWILWLVSALGAFLQGRWVAQHVPWQVAVMVVATTAAALLLTTIKFGYDIQKDHKVVLLSCVCLNASSILVAEWLWFVEELAFTLVVDGFFAACCICRWHLGKWPCQLAKVVEQHHVQQA